MIGKARDACSFDVSCAKENRTRGMVADRQASLLAPRSGHSRMAAERCMCIGQFTSHRQRTNLQPSPLLSQPRNTHKPSPPINFVTSINHPPSLAPYNSPIPFHHVLLPTTLSRPIIQRRTRPPNAYSRRALFRRQPREPLQRHPVSQFAHVTRQAAVLPGLCASRSHLQFFAATARYLERRRDAHCACTNGACAGSSDQGLQ